MLVVAANLGKLTTAKIKSYKCKKATTFYFENRLSMIIKDLQYQAFKSGNSTNFSEAVTCGIEKDGKPNTMYIATGTIVGACLLIVLVLATVHFIRKYRKYDTITF
ncbi:uncharacterized protein LOC134257515 [Saccostrea cucullata]|uniref:uncharacterized protein LOC134257515 n=1 Tax=Saccostrea cuccullata TaxID=36930 RepID=UPI002ED40A9F